MKVVSYYLGLFLRIFSALLLVPVVVGKFYGESFVHLEGFIIAAFISIVLGAILHFYGKRENPSTVQGLIAATLGWIIAVSIGGIPFMEALDMSFVNAFFEAMSGFSTTGMSIVAVEELSKSMLFWRAFMQWVGGLGILTFFVAVVSEAGGAARSLISAEADKTDPGSIRPSPFNAIKSLWYVYIVLTLVEVGALYFFDMSFFNALLYSFTTLPTGGFASTAGGISAFNSLGIEAVVTLFMLFGGTNFLLLYRMLQGDIKSLFENYEFRLFMKIMVAVAVFIGLDLVFNRGLSVLDALRTTIFSVVSITSSTGFETAAINSFPEISRLLFIALMFVGGSLGSTTGGIKVFRFGVLFKVVKREIRSFTLPTSYFNPVNIKDKVIEGDELTRIVAIVVVWLATIFLGGLVTLAYTDLSIVQAVQGMTSAMGTMGPVFMEEAKIVALPPVVKIFWALGMLAGRLEALPILVILNAKFFGE
ncbi:MAG: TrkH family potassium uptake protein [Candidatus Nanohaloarchaeota archaeon QJJ-9]|nr:TrkH family potassium uptake protein [Candidatus Nanohaloarchaeota archaeon QJJ-9]